MQILYLHIYQVLLGLDRLFETIHIGDILFYVFRKGSKNIFKK